MFPGLREDRRGCQMRPLDRRRGDRRARGCRALELGAPNRPDPPARARSPRRAGHRLANHSDVERL
jgi:hypothetical protein